MKALHDWHIWNKVIAMKWLKELFNKYREYILYLVFGGLTTLISWGTFYICTHLLDMDVVPGNIISWIFAVAFAYITNRIWVFESTAEGAAGILKELGGFVAGRLITLGIETALLWITVDAARLNDMLMKVIISIVVLVLNYVFSKWIVFNKKRQEK